MLNKNKYTIKDDTISNCLIFSIIIFTIFYNLGAGIPLLFDINPSVFNFTFKILGSVLLLLSVFYVFFTRGLIISKSLITVFIFWLIYSFRLIYDIEILRIESGFNKSVIYSYAFGGALVSIFALMFATYLLNIRKFLNLFFLIAILSNLIIILLLISKNSSIDISIFFQRSEFSTTNSSEDVSIINPITIGQNGGILIILSFYHLINYKNNLKNIFFHFIKYFLFFSIGLVNLFLGGSRGPTLFVIFILSLIVFFNLYFKRKNILKLFKWFFLLTLSFFIITLYLQNNTSEEIVLLNRFVDLKETATNTSQDERGIIYKTAWNQFVRNPLLGDKFIESSSKWYPHNIILESLMSTGIIGTTLFLIYIFNFLFSILKFNGNHELLLIYFIGLYYFLCCLTSGSLWNSIEIWIFPIIAIYFSKRHIPIIKNQIT